jgi:hypothetical protein
VTEIQRHRVPEVLVEWQRAHGQNWSSDSTLPDNPQIASGNEVDSPVAMMDYAIAAADLVGPSGVPHWLACDGLI